jgi:Skp family chaperone for outer membrane proteins
MKKVLIGIIGLSLLFVSAAAFACPGEMGMGRTANLSAEQQQFFHETKDLRKEMHEKKFELRELYLTNADQAKIDALQTDIEALRAKIQDKAKDLKITSGPGACADQGAGCFTGQGRGCNGNGPCGKQVARGCGNMMDRCGQ